MPSLGSFFTKNAPGVMSVPAALPTRHVKAKSGAETVSSPFKESLTESLSGEEGTGSVSAKDTAGESNSKSKTKPKTKTKTKTKSKSKSKSRKVANVDEKEMESELIDHSAEEEEEEEEIGRRRSSS